MLAHIAHEYLLVLSDLAGDDGQHVFFVLFEEDSYLLLDLELAEIAQEEVLAVVHFVLTGKDVLLDFFDLLADFLVAEVDKHSAG